MEEDIIKIIQIFDQFMDNMDDRGCLDIVNDEYDKSVDNFLSEMKKKYCK